MRLERMFGSPRDPRGGQSRRRPGLRPPYKCSKAICVILVVAQGTVPSFEFLDGFNAPQRLNALGKIFNTPFLSLLLIEAFW